MKKKFDKDLDRETKKQKKPNHDKFDPLRKNKKYHEKIVYDSKSLDF